MPDVDRPALDQITGLSKIVENRVEAEIPKGLLATPVLYPGSESDQLPGPLACARNSSQETDLVFMKVFVARSAFRQALVPRREG
jgi:hypothetical protein